MTIALFTPFAPHSGGGAVQLREMVQLLDLDVDWYYLSNSGAEQCDGWLGPQLGARQLLGDLLVRSVSSGRGGSAIHDLVKRMNADRYWIVAHNEGVSVAGELISQGKSVHMTVHDDPGVTFARSRKYRPFRRLMSKTFGNVLQGADSVDVISSQMQSLYDARYGVQSSVVYRYLPSLPPVSVDMHPGVLRVGHIGHLYHPARFRAFVPAAIQYARSVGKEMSIVTIGSSPYFDDMSKEWGGSFERYRDLEEPDAVRILGSCDVLYAMYPDGKRFQAFRTTSIPMKLTTYILAQRPIFAHTPDDSTLASVVNRYGVGVVCSSVESSSIEEALGALLGSGVERARFERIARELLGLDQVVRLRAALAG